MIVAIVIAIIVCIIILSTGSRYYYIRYYRPIALVGIQPIPMGSAGTMMVTTTTNDETTTGKVRKIFRKNK